MWNHNIHYHDEVLRAIPPGCRRALDAGCGRGELTVKLAERCRDVTGIDRAPFDRADSRIVWVGGDLMTHPLPAGAFDFVSAVAVLHHLPLRPALERLRTLVAPGGVLVVIGLYRLDTVADYAIGCMAAPVSWILRKWRGEPTVGAPILDPQEILGEIRAAAREILPGAVVRRRFFFRYSLIWRKGP